MSSGILPPPVSGSPSDGHAHRHRHPVGRFAALRAYISQHRLAAIIIAGGLVILIASITAYLLIQSIPKPADIPDNIAPPKPKPVVYYSPLTGLKVADEKTTQQAVTAIMIENSPDARPQSGLKQAGVVYEAIAEGGITRFLALYQEAKPTLVGPVRSVREYYVDWLTPYQASVAHVGGSWNALKLVRNGKYRDIDQFFNSGSYWRATDRYAPHNVYTNFKRLDALNKSKGYTTSTFPSWPRADGKAADKPTATNIHINISSSLYNTQYKYDAKNNRYNRYLAGVLHKDREKGTITPSVVIAMHVDMKVVFEDGYREQITTVGSGKATIFQNGTAQNVTWRKKSRSAQLEFLDKNGKSVELVRGQTWIAAVPNGSGSVSW